MSKSCRPNYFMGAPAQDNPSQKVLVADKLATTCPVIEPPGPTGLAKMLEGGTGAALTGIPGGILYASSATEMAITDAGTAGYVLTSNGSGEPFWVLPVPFPVVVGPAGTILRSNGSTWVASTVVFPDTFSANGVLIAGSLNTITNNAAFTWNNDTKNLQLGSTGVSMGTNTGTFTFGIAIGDSAGQFTQTSTSVAIGKSAGNLVQLGTSIALGSFAGQSTQSIACVAIGKSAGYVSQSLQSIAIGNGTGTTRQSQGSIAIGTGSGTSRVGQNVVAIGNNAMALATAAFTQSIAIGKFAGAQTMGRAVAIGSYALQSGNALGFFNTAIGNMAGNFACLGDAIGFNAGRTNQADAADAMGNSAGSFAQGRAAATGTNAGFFQQANDAQALGSFAGCTAQGTGAVAIGVSAGSYSQGANAIAIGAFAGQTSQFAGSIVVNASGAAFTPTQAGFYVNPVRTFAVDPAALTLAVTTSNEIVINSAKTFVINHPLTPETHYLVHACVEGPEAGVYYRGTGTIAKNETTTIIDLPAYVSKLVTDFFLQITMISETQAYKAGPIQDNRFPVTIKEPAKQDISFFWLAIGCRESLETEVLKTQANCQGQGPYQWL
jgi:hypothetical protein